VSAGGVQTGQPGLQRREIGAGQLGVRAQRDARVDAGVAQPHPVHLPATSAEEPHQVGTGRRPGGSRIGGRDIGEAHDLDGVDGDQAHHGSV